VVSDLARWSVDEQIEKVEEKIKELQAKRKDLLARREEINKDKEKKQLSELYAALKAKGIEPSQYADVIAQL
jgi:flagellar motility protein MotE (MotC chaperone)